MQVHVFLKCFLLEYSVRGLQTGSQNKDLAYILCVWMCLCDSDYLPFFSGRGEGLLSS